MSDQLFQRIAADVKLGQRVKIFRFYQSLRLHHLGHLKIGTFVEFQKRCPYWEPV